MVPDAGRPLTQSGICWPVALRPVASKAVKPTAWPFALVNVSVCAVLIDPPTSTVKISPDAEVAGGTWLPDGKTFSRITVCAKAPGASAEAMSTTA